MESFAEDVEEIENLAAETRYIAAYESYLRLMRAIDQRHEESLISSEARDSLRNTLYNKVNIRVMIERAKEVENTLDFEDTGEGWTHGSTIFGITTVYRKCEDGTLIVKIDGVQENLRIFELCAVIHEVDLFQDWVPLCRQSEMIDKVGKAELIPYIHIGIPPLTRDLLMRAYGADCLRERGKILILGKSIDDYTDNPDNPVPWRSIGWGHNRVIVKEYKAIIDVLSATSAKATVIAHVDLNMALPQAVINYIMKNLAGLLLYLMQQQAQKIVENPDCTHAERIRSDKAFYQDWLLPKLREYCDFKGWEQPTVACLGELGLPPSHAVTGLSDISGAPDPLLNQPGQSEQQLRDPSCASYSRQQQQQPAAESSSASPTGEGEKDSSNPSEVAEHYEGVLSVFGSATSSGSWMKYAWG